MTLSEMACHPRLGFVMINLPTKFEVYMFTHYKNTKSNAKCRNLGWFAETWVIQGDRHCHHSIDRI